MKATSKIAPTSTKINLISCLPSLSSFYSLECQLSRDFFSGLRLLGIVPFQLVPASSSVFYQSRTSFAYLGPRLGGSGLSKPPPSPFPLLLSPGLSPYLFCACAKQTKRETTKITIAIFFMQENDSARMQQNNNMEKQLNESFRATENYGYKKVKSRQYVCDKVRKVGWQGKTRITSLLCLLMIHILFICGRNITHYIFRMDYLEHDRLLRADFNKLHKKAAYGTAGFRDLAVNMPYIAFRVGVLVAIINKTQPKKHLGVVISASHNKREDNGVKITNFRGNMLEKEYEPKVEEFVNEENLEFAVKSFKEYLVGKGLTVYETEVTVLIGGDTRPSTESLLKLISDGVQYQQGKALNFHLTTTPQLQYYVYLANVEHGKLITQTEQIRPLFYQNFSQYFTQAADFLGWKNTIERTIDCANGVGAKAMPYFNPLIKKYINANLINTDDDQFLNEECGADHVKTKKKFPRKFQKESYDSYLSFDGDADRIVFYTETEGKLNLIDGDRTGTVLTEFFKRIAKELKEKTEKLNAHDCIHLNVPTDPTIGFVQTYYANYSSSEYLKQNFGMEPLFAATGVKNLHEKAEHYDIGIYFEGNGHGTVIFNQQYLQKLEALLRNKPFLIDSPGVHKQALQELKEYFEYLQFYVNVCKLSNPSVGDAICVFLLFEVALYYLKIDYKDVLKLYTDLESLTSKIGVKTKEVLKVTEMEDKVVEPAGLQDQIEQVLAKHKGKKAFLRASGTENVLRLHVQADTVDQVQAISAEIRQIVIQNPHLN